ncbi:MAG: hypothetical protein N2749_07035 [Clostridia bacterium]|nr:hypothetical protein [Clostridia bacterium]
MVNSELRGKVVEVVGSLSSVVNMLEEKRPFTDVVAGISSLSGMAEKLKDTIEEMDSIKERFSDTLLICAKEAFIFLLEVVNKVNNEQSVSEEEWEIVQGLLKEMNEYI